MSETNETAGAGAPEGKQTTLPLNALKTLKVYTHSPILYWWPVWLLGFLFFFFQGTGLLNEQAAARMQGQTFVFALVFVIFSTTVRLRGANSVIFGLLLAIGAILLAMGNLFTPLARFLGQLDITMSSTFYLFMFVTVFVMWAVMIFGFDRVRFYEVAPGQVHQRVVWGTGDRAESGASARCTYKKDDFLRHRMLGLGITGDIELTLANNEVWEMHNVLFAKTKSKRINELIVTRPID
ncbi:MAG: hypothetical protein GYB42_12750 [Alphaproteobacteria bacterium]|nr:hypothetical protein [Alphaproteobacteria bacterium]